jgi:Flp pilus assembly protein TadG
MITQRRHAGAAPRSTLAGSVLVEFAFIALAFYLLFAGTLELGRMITMSQTIQNAARVGARELALVALPPTATFEEALARPEVVSRIYDARLLAVNIGGGMPNTDTWPVINRMLLPVMVYDTIEDTKLLHFPGAVLRDQQGNFTVGVPNVVARDPVTGVETIRWLPVLEEVRADANDPSTGPFSLTSTGPERGLVALRINCPYQASTLVARTNGPGMHPVLANDGGVTQLNAAPGTMTQGPQGDPAHPELGDGSAYQGRFGLGKFYAMGSEGQGGVRPFRRLIASQSIFRREVFAPQNP